MTKREPDFYTVRHINFGTYYHFDTLADAKAFVIKAYFDAAITKNGQPVTSWSTFGGWR